MVIKLLTIAHNHLWKHNPHGGEISTRIILKHLKSKGFRIAVIHNAPQDQGQANGIKYWSSQGSRLKPLCEEKIEAFKPHILLSWSLEGALTHHLSKQYGIPYIYFIRYWHLFNKPPHTNLLHEPIDHNIVEKYQRIFQDAAILISNSLFTQRVVQRYYNCPSVVSYPPILPLKKLELDRIYLTLVNWYPHKGSKIVEALAKAMPDQHFLGVGNSTLEKDNLKVIPYTHKMPKVYALTKILLCPSQYDEAFGRVALEALSLGIPVIAHRCGGLPEVVGEGGIVLDVGCSLDSWIKAVKTISTSYQAYSRKAIVQSNKFNWAMEVQKIESLIVNFVLRTFPTPPYAIKNGELYRVPKGISYQEYYRKVVRNEATDDDYFKIPFVAKRYNIIKKFVGDKQVLSIGSGVRETLMLNADVALDVASNAGILLKKAGYKGEFIHASCTALPFKDKTFEVAVCSEVIEHLPFIAQIKATFRDMDRVANRWIITTPRERPKGGLGVGHVHWFKKEDFNKIIPIPFKFLEISEYFYIVGGKN